MAKIEDAGELPGLMIEEMMESASLVQGGEEETEQGLLLEEKVTNIIYVATSSHDLSISKHYLRLYPAVSRAW